MKIIKKHHFKILNKSLLKTVVNGFKTEDEDGNFKEWAYLYEILFFHQPLLFLGDRFPCPETLNSE
ncbi:hypothetical protein FACS1894170_07160 [Planctomycetales bacterium]|nr:hypothetical protein FACS1894170_07160 [Planctomycetales bacterium]